MSDFERDLTRFRRLSLGLIRTLLAWVCLLGDIALLVAMVEQPIPASSWWVYLIFIPAMLAMAGLATTFAWDAGVEWPRPEAEL